MLKRLAITLLGLWIAAQGGRAAAHGTPFAVYPGDSSTTLGASLVGANEFFAALNGAAFQLDAHQLEHLRPIAQHFEFEKQIRDGQATGGRPVDADYNRYLAEQALLEFLEHDWPTLITLDLRPGDRAVPPTPDLNIPPLEGIIIFKLLFGAGPPVCAVREVDLAGEGVRGSIPLRAPAAGTAYVLARLHSVRPNQRAHVNFAWLPEGQNEPTHWNGICLMSPACGRLSLSVLDETSQPTPVFLRLSGPGGRFWEPPNAVDLGPTMTHVTGLPIYGPGRAYTHFIPGEFRGPYWILPEAMTTVMPTGEWEVVVYHGAEYKPLRQRIHIQPDATTSITVRLERWTNMPALGWYSGDDHVHGRLQSSADAQTLMAFARAANVNVANILEMGDASRTWYAQAGFGPQYRYQEGPHVLVPGQEDPRSIFGHAIGLNLRSLVRDLDKYLLNDLIADEIHAQGGLYGHTHVGEGGLGIHRDMTLLVPQGKSDFCSIMQNILGTGRYYDFLDLGFKLTASAGSDTPYGGALGVTRVYAFLGKKTPFSADAWFAALQLGHTFVTNGPMLDFQVNDKLPGDELKIKTKCDLYIQGKAWGLAQASAPKSIRIIQSGEVLKEFTNPDPAKAESTFAFKAAVEFGGWYALQAEGYDGSQAHTTPIYVTREGFRHWNPQRAENLIQARLATLTEMDAIVTAKEDELRAGKINPLNRLDILVGQQAAAVRERTQAARAEYEHLRIQLTKELQQRATHGSRP